jgi:4-amino-4-deoxy-L-arabinose transferase-like glycosyltransferase
MSLPAGSLALAPWPTALVPCLRLLWARVLFPGRPANDTRPRVRSLLVLLVLPALLLYPCLRFHLLEPDEGRYAEIAREMLLRGDWVVPHLQGEPYLDKPPLFYWLVVASYSLFGVHDWAARIVPALAVHATILVTYLFGLRLLGERAAFRGALLLSLTPGLMGMGRLLILDGLLTLWVTLGLFAGLAALQAHPRWRVGFWVCALVCGLGVLTKGPVAVLLVVPPLLLHCWLTTGVVRVSKRDVITFAALVLAINLPWYVAVSIRRPEFGAYFFVQHNLQRFLAPFDHLEPVWYYAPVLLGGLLPGTLLAWPFARWLLFGDADAARGRSPELGFCLLAGGWCVLFFSLSGSKLPTYILPAFPFLALALGNYWESTKSQIRNPKSQMGRIGIWDLGFGIWFVLLLFTNYVALPWYAALRSPLGAPAAELRAACADPAVAVCCYPRNCDSAAFYLGRDDLRPTRSKFAHLLVEDLLTRERTVVLFTHRHSLAALKFALPPDLRVARAVSFRRDLPGPAWLTRLLGDTPWGLCDLAVIERTRPLP